MFRSVPRECTGPGQMEMECLTQFTWKYGRCTGMYECITVCMCGCAAWCPSNRVKSLKQQCYRQLSLNYTLWTIKCATLFSITTPTLLAHYYNFCTSRNRKKYSRINLFNGFLTSQQRHSARHKNLLNTKLNTLSLKITLKILIKTCRYVKDFLLED